MAQLMGEGRSKELVRVRRLIVSCATKYTPRTAAELSRALRRDRTTIIHTMTEAHNAYEKDGLFRDDVSSVWLLAVQIDARATSALAERVSREMGAPALPTVKSAPAANVVARRAKERHVVEYGSPEWFKRNHERFVEGLREAAAKL
jgi:hypothetical protein